MCSEPKRSHDLGGRSQGTINGPSVWFYKTRKVLHKEFAARCKQWTMSLWMHWKWYHSNLSEAKVGLRQWNDLGVSHSTTPYLWEIPKKIHWRKEKERLLTPFSILTLFSSQLTDNLFQHSFTFQVITRRLDLMILIMKKLKDFRNFGYNWHGMPQNSVEHMETWYLTLF